MKLKLEPYQQLARDFFLNHERAGGFIGLGCGKTALTLSTFKELLLDGAVRSMLVIAPLRVANLTWPNEVEKWDEFRDLRVEHLRDNGDKPSGKAHIYLTNYDRLIKTVKKVYPNPENPGEPITQHVTVPRLGDLSFCDLVVFDELTRAKNPNSSQINALRPLLKPPHRRIGLTGTPRPNSLLELYAQIRLLDDGKRLGPSFHHFRSTWFTPEDWNEYRWNPKPDAERRIYEKIHDLIITLRSSDYLGIADTTVEDIEVPLPKDAHAVYRELERELAVSLGLPGEEMVVAQNAAVLVNKLLQVCGGTVYVTDDTAEVASARRVSIVHDGKIKALKKLLLDLDEPAIIACNYIHERERVVASLGSGAVDASKFKGDIEDAWNSGAIRCLVADPRSLGHGLNLQAGGRNIVWFTPTWSRELYDQFNARVARKGQQLPPRVYRLVCPGTIEDAVIETLRVRGEAQSEMLSVLTNFRRMGRTFP